MISLLLLFIYFIFFLGILQALPEGRKTVLSSFSLTTRRSGMLCSGCKLSLVCQHPTHLPLLSNEAPGELRPSPAQSLQLCTQSIHRGMKTCELHPGLYLSSKDPHSRLCSEEEVPLQSHFEVVEPRTKSSPFRILSVLQVPRRS